MATDSKEPMSKTCIGFASCMLGMTIGLLIGFFLSFMDIQRFKRQAVEAGVAEFVADKTGSVDFIWKNLE